MLKNWININKFKETAQEELTLSDSDTVNQAFCKYKISKDIYICVHCGTDTVVYR